MRSPAGSPETLTRSCSGEFQVLGDLPPCHSISRPLCHSVCCLTPLPSALRLAENAGMSNFSHHDEHEDLANPRGPRKQLLLVVALAVGLLVLGAVVLALFLKPLTAETHHKDTKLTKVVVVRWGKWGH